VARATGQSRACIGRIHGKSERMQRRSRMQCSAAGLGLSCLPTVCRSLSLSLALCVHASQPPPHAAPSSTSTPTSTAHSALPTQLPPHLPPPPWPPPTDSAPCALTHHLAASVPFSAARRSPHASRSRALLSPSHVEALVAPPLLAHPRPRPFELHSRPR
jgi:hypothetical protein